MLARRKPPRSGIERAPKRTWRRHETWVRGFVCIAFKADGANCSGKVEFCHVRSAADAGTGLKPPSWLGYPGCSTHHAMQHQIGQPAFERRFGVSLRDEALKLARISPDLEMRAVMRDALESR